MTWNITIHLSVKTFYLKHNKHTFTITRNCNIADVNMASSPYVSITNITKKQDIIL